MKNANKLIVFAIAIFLSSSCKNETGGKKKKKVDETTAAVTDDKPQEVTIVKKWEMPSALREISGLSYLDEQRLACVQDELGKVYIYNLTTEKIEREIPFEGPGDFEGLAVAGKDLWVLRADGKLFEIKNFESKEIKSTAYETPMTRAQDCEGLCYDPKGNRLLITVKERDLNSNTYKGVYAFSLSSFTMSEEPVYKVNFDDAVFTDNNAGNKKKNGNSFMPSAIAIHPTTGELYITDGPKSKLLIMDADGNIEQLVQLDKTIFPQPEGIIFNSNGDLFISNEGPKEPGNILQVKLEKRRSE